MAKRFDGIDDYDNLGTLNDPVRFLKDLAKESMFDMTPWQEQVLKEVFTNGGKTMSLQSTLFGQPVNLDSPTAPVKSVTPEEVERLRQKVINQRRELKRLNKTIHEFSDLATSRLQSNRTLRNRADRLEDELSEAKMDLEHEQALVVYYHSKLQKAEKKAAKKASRKA